MTVVQMQLGEIDSGRKVPVSLDNAPRFGKGWNRLSSHTKKWKERREHFPRPAVGYIQRITEQTEFERYVLPNLDEIV